MMIGEFDFDDTFNSDVTVPGVTWFLFIVFLIVVTLILMNLLVINLITERFSNDFRTTNAKVTTPANNKEQTARGTNQNSEQLPVTCSKRRKNCAFKVPLVLYLLLIG